MQDCLSLISEEGNNLVIDDIFSSDSNDEVRMSEILDILNMQLVYIVELKIIKQCLNILNIGQCILASIAKKEG